ncbi:AAA-like domain-containing protein [Trichocoleus sp. FACHB-591]|uniref:AAA-like domain-containing protein n=1 Tax=Trichocoleus sp. FACHB-591 TaxID=2692872 RepID=UPI001687CA54|nr:AAA-like domain-containing protein [Trichocoleus sp. FACHB-591]MBD2097682.1 AAA-like domain-containing protein [Trichocoleus sp. FACHB-591]
MSSTSARKKRTILFLATNPKNSAKLRLDEEFRDVSEALKGSKNRSRFDLKPQWATRRRDVRRAMLDYAPQIVHFSGHGAGEPGLLIENELGQAELLTSDALIGLFEDANQVECVLLNACYSEVQAKAIAQHVPYVIGMNQEVGDKAALEFAVGFYDALGAGLSIERAYKEGCKGIRMAGIPEYLTPVLEHITVKPEGEVQEKGSLSPPECSTEFREETLPESSAVSPLSKSAVGELEETGGQVPLDSPFYTERPPAESRCYGAIVKPGALIRVKAPRQMGKSSLTIRVFDHASKQGCRAVWLQLQQAGEEPFASLDAFLRWLCRRVTAKLRLQDKVVEYWQSVSASTDKCTDYFELYLLEEINAPLVLCLDEVDEVFKHPQVAGDFFGLLRSWHEEAKINPVWCNLRLVITHSEEVYIPLNINQSPFNVGVPIELPPLSQAQLNDLVQRHGLAWTEAELDSLMAMVGGQPYLARVALQQIASGALTLAQFLQVAPTQAGVFAAHLKRHLGNLQERQLDTAMKQVVASEHPVQLPITQAAKLANMGLVRFQGNEVVPLCNLYRNYFQDVLGGSR